MQAIADGNDQNHFPIAAAALKSNAGYRLINPRFLFFFVFYCFWIYAENVFSFFASDSIKMCVCSKWLSDSLSPWHIHFV